MLLYFNFIVHKGKFIFQPGENIEHTGTDI